MNQDAKDALRDLGVGALLLTIGGGAVIALVYGLYLASVWIGWL